MAAEKLIGLRILKTDANIETIKIFISNLKQKLSLLAFFQEDKNKLKHKY